MTVKNYLTDQTSVQLRRAILLYNGGDGGTVATIHEVAAKPGEPPFLGPGRCLTRAALNRTVRELAGVKATRAVLHPRVLSVDPAHMVWWTPSERRPIWFATKDERFNVAVNGQAVRHPALVFRCVPGALYVYALAAAERPDATTPLFQAPYMNIYADGAMCQGNASLPKQIAMSDIPAWEAAFFETNFSHTNVGIKDGLCKFAGGHNGLWRAMQKPGAKAFPADALLPRTAAAVAAGASRRPLTVEDIVNL